MTAFRSHPATADRLRCDPDALPGRDRACLRLLGRADAATAGQLATLLYGRRRTAQERLQRLWEAGLIERMPAPQHRPGTSPYAYRLSAAARLRLGIAGRRPAGPTILRHTLDGVAIVCALVAHDRTDREPPVQAWLPERMLGNLDLGTGVAPDGLVVLQSDDRSGVLCLEVDEGTQHAGVVRPRLEAYARALASRPGWALLVVVPTRTRAAWLGRWRRASRLQVAARIAGWPSSPTWSDMGSRRPSPHSGPLTGERWPRRYPTRWHVGRTRPSEPRDGSSYSARAVESS